MSCIKSQCYGPGYETPEDAINGPKEKLLYVTCVQPKVGRDYLAVVDVNPKSSTYSKVISRAFASYDNDEFHHTGWNSCSSCFNDASLYRDKLIVPCLNSSRIYVFDTSDPIKPKLFKIIESLSRWKLSAPHTSHCTPDKDIIISCMGDENRNAKGSFVVLDGKTFEIKNVIEQSTKFGYDFWYQPRFNIMVSSEWGSPNVWSKGFSLDDVNEGSYGHHLHFWDFKSKRLIQSLDLGPDGMLPLEVRFFHNPSSSHGYVGCALSSTVFHFYLSADSKWQAEKVIQIVSKKVKDWPIKEMPGLITDILISMDDRFLFISCWLHGDIRQYDVKDPFNPCLVSSILIGGIMDMGMKMKNDLKVKGKAVRGGPQMLQLSLDGERLYVTNSLYSSWDKQFYPDMYEKGSMMFLIEVSNRCLKINEDFLVDFGEEPLGPVLAHEIRYPGGDCTSDIWC